MMKILNFLVLLLTISSANAFDIIAHRGASGFLPEHTKEAATLAFMQGADFIEQDLVLSKDNQLIVLHDIHLENVTNVEEIYPSRKRSDGRYYVIDFTLHELRRLHVHERTDINGMQVFPDRYQGKGHFSITTFAEQIELIQQLNRQFNKDVGLYPEIKAPEFHLAEGKDITQVFMNELKNCGLNTKSANIIVQSFYPPTLRRIRDEFGDEITLVQLIADNHWQESSTDYSSMKSAEGMRLIANYADGIGPWIPHILDQQGNSTGLIDLAKQAGLLIHAYTFRMDAPAIDLPPTALYNALRHSGIHGIFTDQVLPFMVNN